MSSIAIPSETPVHSARWDWYGYPSLDAWRWASAVAVAAELRRDLNVRPRARLLLSGGSTPVPVYRALAKAPLDWDRIDVALVDERWLMPDDPDSNARLVRTELLSQHAAKARFEATTSPGRSIEQAVAAANAHGQQAASVVVLGMGDDGHIASLFPQMHGLRNALSSRQNYVSVDAHNCPGAGVWGRRISMTPAGMVSASARLLLIRGQHKREVFERAIASGDELRFPVLAALSPDNRAPLQIYWCP